MGEGLGEFADLKGGLGKKDRGGVFEGGGGDTPVYTMKLLSSLNENVVLEVSHEKPLFTKVSVP